MEETLNFDEYPEFARQMGNRGSRGRAFRAFINQNHNGKTLLNLFFYSYFFILFLSIIHAVCINIGFFVLQSLVTCHRYVYQ